MAMAHKLVIERERKAEQSDSGKKKQSRMSIGPVMESTVLWFDQEAERVAKVENVRKCSKGTLLNRVAWANIDLTQKGVEAYVRDRKRRRPAKTRR